MMVLQTRTLRLPLDEAEHHLLQGLFPHLAVADGDFRLGDQGSEEVGHGADRLYPVVDEEDLAAAAQLAQDRLADQLVVEAGDVGAHRQAVDRRGVDHREVAQPHQAHVQGARDRRGGQGEHVDLGAQFLEPLLVGDAEALLLVDDHQAEVA